MHSCTGASDRPRKSMEYEDHCLQEPSAAICNPRDGQVPASPAQGYTVPTSMHGDPYRVRTAAAGHEATRSRGWPERRRVLFLDGHRCDSRKGMLRRCLSVFGFFGDCEKDTARRFLKCRGSDFMATPGTALYYVAAGGWWWRWYSESHAYG
ncbi:hypothetical protein GGI43DRAFT_411350 [Trichoderma evansii]